MENSLNDVDFEDIVINKVYSNMREVCEDLSLPYDKYKGGSSRESLISKLDEVFDYERNINSKYDYKFTKFHGEPLLDMSDLTDKSKTVKLSVVNSIVEHIKRHPNSYESKIYFRWSDLFQELGMVNSNYDTYKRKQDELAEVLNVSDFAVNDFYDTTQSNIKNSIEYALNSLQKDNALRWNEVFRLVYMNTDKNIFNSEIESDYCSRIATPKEHKMAMQAIDEAYEYIYDEWGYSETSFATKKKTVIAYLFKKNMWGYFYKTQNRIMSKLMSDYYQKEYIIIGIYDVVEIIENMYRFEKYEKILKDSNFSKSVINKKISDNLIKNANNRLNKAEDKQEIYDNTIDLFKKQYELSEKDKKRLDAEFAEDFVKTVNYCIKRDINDDDDIIRELKI